MQKFPANTRHWLAAFAIAFLYTAIYAAMIHRDNAIPYWDQSGYIQKVYSLTDKWNSATLLTKFNPLHYLNAAPAMRGPLMAILPALLFGNSATPHQIAYTWLLERMSILMLALYLWTKLLNSSHWLLPALCAILGTHWFLSLNQNLYLMDLPCASLALLYAGVAGLSLKHRQSKFPTLTCLAALALLLLKPQTAAFITLVSTLLIIERFFHDKNFRRTLIWCLPFILLAALMLGLFFSAYGRGVRAEYQVGLRGYWTQKIPWQTTLLFLSGVLPGWILLLVAFRLWCKSNVRFLDRFWMAFGALLGWVGIALGLVYAIDPRILWMIMPISICIAIAFICTHPRLRLPTTLIALTTFFLSISIALSGTPLKSLDLNILAGPRIVEQPPIPEIGLLPLVNAVDRAIPEITVLINDEFIDYSALNLAAHLDHLPTKFLVGPIGNSGLKPNEIFGKKQYFLTRPGERSWNLKPIIVADMRSASDLITNEKSPIHSLFKRVAAYKVETPQVGELGILPTPGEGQTRRDAITLWQLKRPINNEEIKACQAYLRLVHEP